MVGVSGASFYLKSLYADGLIYNACLTFVKLSVLCFYRRIFATTVRARLVLWITACVTIAWCVSVELTCVLECVPVRAAWDSTTPAKCINFLQFYYGSAGSSIVLDFALLIIPVPFLWRLHMDWTHKLALTTTFLLGYLYALPHFRSRLVIDCHSNPIVSFVRLAYLIRLGSQVKAPDITCEYAFLPSENEYQQQPSGNYVDLTAWSIAECSVALISAHIPALQFLFTLLVKKAKRTAINSKRTGTQLDGDKSDLVANRKHPDGSFRRLVDDRDTLGFKSLPDQYGALAYSNKQSSGNDEYELEPADHIASRIHVSRRIDVISSEHESQDRSSLEHV